MGGNFYRSMRERFCFVFFGYNYKSSSYVLPCQFSYHCYCTPSPPRVITPPWVQRLPIALPADSPLHIPLPLHPCALLVSSSIPVLRRTRLVIIFFRRHRRSSRSSRRTRRRTPPVRGERGEHHVCRLMIHISGRRRHHSRPRMTPRPPRHLRHLPLHPRVFLRRRGHRPSRAHLAWAHEDGDGP